MSGSKKSTVFLLQWVLVFLVHLVPVATVSPEEEERFYTNARHRFATSSPAIVLEIWHRDCHRRCFAQLLPQVEIACQFDPYRAPYPTRSRRQVSRVPKIDQGQMVLPGNSSSLISQLRTGSKRTEEKASDGSPFLDKRSAATFFRKRAGSLSRVKRSGIMDECCYRKACAWEEYAEYCHRHPRVPHSRQSVCTYS
ncbi:probable insulin-like peptide 7 isoform X2 [Physella acuta]|nr:probable insulin-like peptide 7 isoform X2 [Physella acuta]